MRLWYSPASPFVRKVMIVAHETGLADRIEIAEVTTTVLARDANLVRDNPSGKIPAMVLDDGSVLFDSRVICACLDSLHGGAKLIPESGPERFRVMTLEALGDGTMEAAVLVRYEQALRPEEKRWDKWVEGQMAKVNSSLDDAEARWMELLEGPINMGAVSVGAALGYLDYRFPDIGWRDGRPRLAAWHTGFAGRPSMKATAPHP